MPTKTELILEQSQQGISNDVLSALRHSGDSSKLNLPDHRSRRWCRNHIPAESDSFPHVHAQATNTYYHHQDLRIKKAKDQKRQSLPQTLIFKIFLKDIKIIKTKIVKGDC
ncbi:hypothetical protein Tco_1469700 [Tanacetum coccineum]